MSSSEQGFSDRRRQVQRRYHPRSTNDAQAHADASAVLPESPCLHPLAAAAKPQLVTQTQELAELIAHLRSAGSFAYDSEFIGETSYVPKLCLIQAASATRVALIDPLADVDLMPFWELVADATVEKIVHAGQQDVEPVFRLLGKAPANLFDTQIAAGMIGLGYPLSLSKLVHCLVGAKLSKGVTLTHWDRRPLSELQLRYAADDVRYLPAVRYEIARSLEPLGHLAWALEESAELTDANLYGFNPDEYFLKIRGASSLPPRNRAVLRELTIWRNQGAKASDVPPRALVKDEILISMARNPPKSVQDLARVRGLPRPVEQDHGSQMVEACNRAMSLADEQLPADRADEPTPPEKFRGDALHYAAQCLCAGRQIDPNLAVSRQEIGQLYALVAAGKDPSHLRVLTGWRRAAIGQYLLDLLQGKLNFRTEWHDGHLKAAPGSM